MPGAMAARCRKPATWRRPTPTGASVARSDVSGCARSRDALAVAAIAPSGTGLPMAHDPADLIDAVRAGDRVALEALLRAVRPQIHRQAERRCLAHAEEATQEALWIVYRKAARLRAIAALPAWLARIVARICAGLVSPMWRRIESLKEADADRAATALDAATRIDLAHAIDQLPEPYRVVVDLHYIEGLSVADLAARLGLSTAAAKVRLFRARERLRRRFGDGAAAP